MSFKSYKKDFLRLLGNALLYSAINALCKTLRISIRNGDCVRKLTEENKRYVLAFWHGSMLIPWFINREANFAALVSKSKDGALLERILRKWNYRVIRGSSHTGGSVALGILIDCVRNDRSVSITPDGPRGPAHVMKPGAVIMAKRAKVPLVMLGVGYKKKRMLKSWDKFEVPGFFSRVNLVFSDPVYINADLSYEDTSRLIHECGIKLNELHNEANNF